MEGHLIPSISMVDTLGGQSPDVLPGEHPNVDLLSGLVVTVVVIPAARRLAPPVLHLPPSPPLKEPPLVVVVVPTGVELSVCVEILAVRVQAALPVSAVVEADRVDGEVAHVVQTGAPGSVQSHQLIVPTGLPALRAELQSPPSVGPLALPAPQRRQSGLIMIYPVQPGKKRN